MPETPTHWGYAATVLALVLFVPVILAPSAFRQWREARRMKKITHPYRQVDGGAWFRMMRKKGRR